MYYETGLIAIDLNACPVLSCGMTISEYLCGNSYPGRIIIAGTTPSGRLLYAYAIMGRSPNSRNRVFEVSDGEVRTKAHDESLVKDPSLIIYPAVLRCGTSVIVTNGDQTLDIREALSQGKTMQDALAGRTFEPDGPNWTPRISLVISSDGFEFAINRRREDGECERSFWKYPAEKGVFRIIHTYDRDGNPLPSFSGTPREIEAEDAFSDALWNALDRDNRISLYVNEGGKETVFNAREGD